jgi:deoxyadenosine/deoxycytidine kinase
VSKSMRLGICGPHGAGKTTLITDLYTMPEFEDIVILPEITRAIKAKGFKINEEGTLDTQILIMNTHIENLLYHDRFIVDRCLVDGVVYTQFLYEKGKIPNWFISYAESLFSQYISRYDHLFYIPAEFDLVKDGVRSEDEQFYRRIKEIFKNWIDFISHDFPWIPLTVVTGTTAERVQKIISAIAE